MAEEVLRFRIIGDDSNFQRSMGRVERSLLGVQKATKKVNSVVKNFAKVGAVVGTASVFAVKKLADMGAGVEEMENKFKIVFKGVKKDADDWAKDFAKKVGRNKNTIKEAMANFSDLTQGMGLAKKESLNLSKNMITLATDLASFNNVSDSQAIEAMSAAMMGEVEMAKQLGLGLNEAVMKTSEFTKATGKSWEELDRAERAQVYYQEALKQSANALDDAENSSGSYTNQMKALKANLEQIGQSIGMVLLPALTPLITYFSNLAIKVQENMPIIKKTIESTIESIKKLSMDMWKNMKDDGTLATIKSDLIKFRDVLVRLGNWIVENNQTVYQGLKLIAGGIIALNIASTVATAITLLTNALKGVAIVAGAIGGALSIPTAAVIAIGVAVVGTTVLVVKNWNLIKKVTVDTWNTIKARTVETWEGIKGKILSAVMGMKLGVSNFTNSVKDSFISMANGAINAVNKLISAINKIPTINIPKIPNLSGGGGSYKTTSSLKASAQQKAQADISAYRGSVTKNTISSWYTHASGGILTKPTFSGNHLAGESGAEAIIPLTNKTYVKPFAQTIADLMGNNNGINITIQNAVVREEADITKVARQLQFEIDKKNRSKGVR